MRGAIRLAGLLAAMFLAGCLAGFLGRAEADVRAELDPWFRLGPTGYFRSTWDCTAAMIATESTELRAALPMVTSVSGAVRHLKRGEAVALLMPGHNVSDLSSRIATQEFSLGLGLINSARAAESCMSEAFRAGFLAVLDKPDAILIYDPVAISLTIFDVETRMLFHTRGAL